MSEVSMKDTMKNGLTTVYYKNGKVVKATSSIQTKEQVVAILDEQFGK